MRMVVDILILGAGWSSQFLRPICDERGITHAATTRSGRDSTIKFDFDPDSNYPEPYYALPQARVVLITFPIVVKGASERLVRLYAQTHPSEGDANHSDAATKFIQFGTTGIWDGARLNLEKPPIIQDLWYDRHSGITSTPRAEAENELLTLNGDFPTTVLNLAGLWGGARSPKNWVGRVAGTKEGLKDKGSLHVIHGIDVARAVLAVCGDFGKAKGQRWLLTDNRVYDWWDLASAWGTPTVQSSLADTDKGPQAAWVRELMDECGVRALPRDVQQLGRALDSREFWTTFGITPVKPLLQD